MSAHYRLHGSTFPTDAVRSALKSPIARTYFDKTNQESVDRPPPFPGKREGGHLSGVYIKDLNRSTYVFQFYPLHPLWMAISGSVLGEANSPYSLTLFSLLSLAFLFLLGRDLGGRKAALLCGLFLALNPIHAFFSKLPVSEVVSLAFSAGAFWYLLRFYRCGFTRTGKLSLVISTGLFACVFFTHISGFLFLPIFGLLFLLYSNLKEPSYRWAGRALTFIFLFYAVSVAYGLYFSFPYAYDVYRFEFAKVLGDSWLWVLAIAATLLLGLAATITYYRHGVASLLRRHQRFFQRLLLLTAVVVFALSVWRGYQFAFTSAFADDPFLGKRFGIANLGWKSITYTNIWVFATYLTPLGFAAFFLCFKKLYSTKISVELFCLFSFLVIAGVLKLFLRFALVYQYYYARYLLSELIPYALLAVAVMLAPLLRLPVRRFKTIAAGVVAGSIILISLYHSAFQLRGRPGAGAYEALRKIANFVGDRDILFVSGLDISPYPQIRLPLEYFFDKRVFAAFPIRDVARMSNLEFRSPADHDLLVLTDAISKKKWLSPVTNVEWTNGRFEQVNRPPKRFVYDRRRLYLYRVNRDLLPKTGADDRPIVLRPKFLRKNLSGFVDTVWTNGNGQFVNLAQKVPPDCSYLVVVTAGWHPYHKKLTKLGLAVLVNGRQLDFSHRKMGEFWFQWPADITRLDKIEIRSATFVPTEVGTSKTDTRTLGLDVLAVELKR